MQFLSIQSARKVLDGPDSFNIEFWTKEGKLIRWDNVICTSTYFENNTAKILSETSGEFRTVRVNNIKSINGKIIQL